MRSVKGIYDGEIIKVIEDVTDLQPEKVIITFVEEKDDVESLRNYPADEDAFHFWKEDEDLYQDYLKKER